MGTLINILRYDSIFKDVYREVGLLEVMVTCLHRYAALLKESQGENDVKNGESNIGKFKKNIISILWLGRMCALTSIS